MQTIWFSLNFENMNGLQTAGSQFIFAKKSSHQPLTKALKYLYSTVPHTVSMKTTDTVGCVPG